MERFRADGFLTRALFPRGLAAKGAVPHICGRKNSGVIHRGNISYARDAPDPRFAGSEDFHASPNCPGHFLRQMACDAAERKRKTAIVLQTGPPPRATRCRRNDIIWRSYDDSKAPQSRSIWLKECRRTRFFSPAWSLPGRSRGRGPNNHREFGGPPAAGAYTFDNRSGRLQIVVSRRRTPRKIPREKENASLRLGGRAVLCWTARAKHGGPCPLSAWISWCQR